MTKRSGGPGATTEEAYQVWKAVSRVQALMVTELERRTAAAGVIPPMWLDLLLKLSHAPDRRLRMSDLAESAFLTRGGATRLVTRIETEGLLRREPCPDDKRGAFAILTRKGTDALRRASPIYRKALEEKFGAHLTHARARDAADGLEAVLIGNGWEAPAADRTTLHGAD